VPRARKAPFAFQDSDRSTAIGVAFRTTAHAGEAAGAASVWGAVRALRVDRIGHGTRAAEDPKLVKHLAASVRGSRSLLTSEGNTSMLLSKDERTFVPKTDLLQGTLDLLILKILTLGPDPRVGYWMKPDH
jgi:hypothetical protein